MKILKVFFHEAVRIFGNETLTRIDLETDPKDKEAYELFYNEKVRALRVNVISGQKKGASYLIPMERVACLHVAAQ